MTAAQAAARGAPRRFDDEEEDKMHASDASAAPEDVARRDDLSVIGLYERFEQAIVLILTGVIAMIVVAAVYDLTANVVTGLIVNRTLDPTDHAVFRSVFGMILTVIIALEFKRSILVQAERRSGIVAARSVILIGLLAVVRKIILDLGEAEGEHLIAFAAAILSLGAVYWLVRDQDRKERLSGGGEPA